MRSIRPSLPLLLLALFIAPLAATASDIHDGEKATLSEHLEPLRPYLGKAFRGTLSGSTPEQPKVDVQRWERALGGHAVRIRHSINDGEYGGETLVVWDSARESLVYYYFTTGGFYTHGTFTIEDGGKLTAHEKVTGEGMAAGITEVRSTYERMADGRVRTRAQMKKNGEWVDGHEIVYVEAPGAEVVFE